MKRVGVLALAPVLVGALALAGAPRATRGMRWSTAPTDEAIARARAERKLVLLDAWAVWCAPCHVMDREVWSRDDLARALAREVVPVRAEVDRVNRIGLALGDRFGIDAVPQIVFIDPQTAQVVERLEGVQTPEQILEALDRARLKVDPGQAVATAAEDSGALVRLAGRLVRAGRLAEARQALETALTLDRDCARDDGDDAALLLATLEEQAGRPARALEVAEDAVTRCPRSTGAPELWRRLVGLAPRAGGAAAEDRLLRLRAQRLADDAEAQRALAAFLIRQRRDLATAEQAALRAVALAPDDPAPLATLAELRLVQHDLPAAQAMIERAIAIDPHDAALRELRLRITRAAAP